MKYLAFALAFSSLKAWSLPSLEWDSCALQLQNSVSFQVAQTLEIPVQDILVLRFQWTTPSARAEIALETPFGRKYFQLTVNTQTCQLEQRVPLLSQGIPREVQVAEDLKRAIGRARYFSEADAPWLPYASHGTVGSQWDQEEIRKTLGAGSLPMKAYSQEETLSILDQVIADPEMEESFAYGQLKVLLLKVFDEVHGYRVGVPDSGGLYLFILGRMPDGHLVGLVTLSVET